MKESEILVKSFQTHTEVLKLTLQRHTENIQKTAKIVTKTLQDGGKIIFFGNGGSAAESQHIAAEYVGRYLKERKSLPAISLTTDTSILTAIGNDYGFDLIFQRQVESLVNYGDVVFAISTSGNSENVINAVKTARNQGATIIALTGEGGGKLSKFADVLIDIPSSETPRIQEIHTLINHTICNIVEENF